MSNHNFDEAAKSRRRISGRIELSVTPAQLNAVRELVDEAEAMLGVGEDDSQREKWVRLAKRMLDNNASYYNEEEEMLALVDALGYGPGRVRFVAYERDQLPDGTIAVVKCGESSMPILAQYRTGRLFGPASGFRTLDLPADIDDAVTHFAVI